MFLPKKRSESVTVEFDRAGHSGSIGREGASSSAGKKKGGAWEEPVIDVALEAEEAAAAEVRGRGWGVMGIDVVRWERVGDEEWTCGNRSKGRNGVRGGSETSHLNMPHPPLMLLTLFACPLSYLSLLLMEQAERLSRELRDFDQMLADREHRKRVDQWRNDKLGR